MKKIKLTVVLVLTLIIIQNSFSQVLISNSAGTPNNSAMLEIASTTKGMLIPRMSTTQRNTLGSLPTTEPGLLVFDITLGSFFIYGKTLNGANGWIDLSTDAGIWTRSDTCIYLSDPKYNVGIGTSNPSKKLVIQANNSTDTLMEILDKDGKPLMILTPTLTKFYFNESNKKGIAGGFAVGRYATAKAISDTALFIVTPDSTRVYTSGLASTVEAGGFAVGRYATAKGSPIKFFNTNIHNTRVYTDGDAKKGIAGGFAVGRYATAKGENTHKYFYADIDSTRVYTDGSGTKGIAGGFAVGRYATAKAGGKDNYMYMIPENYFIGDSSGLEIQKGNGTGIYNTFFGYKTGMNDTSGGNNVFIGRLSGYNNTSGHSNVFLGNEAGYKNEGNPSFPDEGVRNVFLGYKAGYENSTGGYNVFIGNDAGHNSTSGFSNTFVGTIAGNNNGTGSYNTYIGDNAGKNLSSGNRNTILGTQAGQEAISGNNNIFMGYNAGKRHNSGDNNIYLGYEAGIGTGTTEQGINNIFIGTQTGSINTTGRENIFMGYQSGYSNTYGNYNVFLGNTAGYSNNGGRNNVFLGNTAGYSNTDGDENCYIGNRAGYYNQSGGDNTMLGKSAGYSSSGSYNTFLGRSAGGKCETDSNTYIGWASGLLNKTGKGNVFLGANAGTYGYSGSYNVVLGQGAGKLSGTTQTLGSGNIIIGYHAAATQNGITNKLFIENSNSSTPLIWGDFDNDIVKIYSNLNINNAYTFPNSDGSHNYVMITDGSGNLSWINANSIVSGDNLGNHSATFTLDLNNHAIIDVGSITMNEDRWIGIGSSSERISFDGSSGLVKIYSDLNINNSYTFPHSDGSTDEIMTTDGSGNVSWTNINSIVSGDNLGDHSATSNLDMNNHAIIDVGSITMNEDKWIGIGSSSERISFDGSSGLVKVYSDLNINNSYTFPHSDGSLDEVMTTDGSGNVSWTNVNSIVSGDNLGNHSATSTLDLNDHMVIDIGSLVMNEDRWIGIGATSDRISFDGSNGLIKIYSDLNINNSYTFPHSDGSIDKVMTTDGSGNISWTDVNSIVSGDNLGNHSATTSLDMNNNAIIDVGGITMNEDKWIGIGSSSERISFDGSGGDIELIGADVGIGTTSPSGKLDIRANSGSTTPTLRLVETAANDGARLIFSNSSETSNRWTLFGRADNTHSSSEFNIYYSGVGDMITLTGSGRIGIKRTPAANSFEVNGQASKTASGSWLANSDKRIKTEILDIENAKETLLKLRPVKFKYTEEWKKREPSIKDHFYYNYIAQEFQKVFPNSVQGSGEFLEGDNKEILQIDTYNAQIITTKAVQELIIENRGMNKKINNDTIP